MIPYIRRNKTEQRNNGNRATRQVCTSTSLSHPPTTENVEHLRNGGTSSKYTGLQNEEHDRQKQQAERATTTRIEDIDLETAAQTQEEATLWKQPSQDMKYILTSITTGAAAIVCRQHQQETGHDIYRQLCHRYVIPTGTRSIGNLTKLLQPTSNLNNFEENVSNWKLELARVEQENNTTLSDHMKGGDT